MNEHYRAYAETNRHYEALNEWCQHRDGHPTVWATMLYGSQNYGLESPNSDVDTKTMVLPSLAMVIKDSSRVSTEVSMADGSLDNCKDVREMFTNFLKSNINFLEVLFTNYYVVNRKYSDEFLELRDMRHLIANCQPRRLMHAAFGMAQQKFVAFEKPFEGKKKVLEQWGYDPKQLHHQVRLYYFLQSYFDTQDFETALLRCHPHRDKDAYNFTMGFKLRPYPYTVAKAMSAEYYEKSAELCDASSRLPDENKYDMVKSMLDGLAYRVIRKHLRKEVLADE